MLGTILLIILILLLIGALPSWGHSRSWGYGPSGGLGLVRHHHPYSRADGPYLIGRRTAFICQRPVKRKPS